MSEESPYKVVVSVDGISCRVECDVHYVSDENIQAIRDAFSELNDEIKSLRGQNVLLRDAASMVREQNAGLRELARVFYHCTTSGKCDYCPINVGDTVHLMPDTICDTLHDRMRELGVEVEQ